MLLTSADVTEDGQKQHVPIHNTSLGILVSTSQSRRNTGPLFEENGQHRSLLKKRFITEAMGALDSRVCVSALLKHTQDIINILLVFSHYN